MTTLGNLPGAVNRRAEWLRRDLGEKEPTLKNFAKVVRELEQRQVED